MGQGEKSIVPTQSPRGGMSCPCISHLPGQLLGVQRAQALPQAQPRPQPGGSAGTNGSDVCIPVPPESRLVWQLGGCHGCRQSSPAQGILFAHVDKPESQREGGSQRWGNWEALRGSGSKPGLGSCMTSQRWTVRGKHPVVLQGEGGMAVWEQTPGQRRGPPRSHHTVGGGHPAQGKCEPSSDTLDTWWMPLDWVF